MPEYQIIGINAKTGRKNTRLYAAPDESRAVELALLDGVHTILQVELQDPPVNAPTDAQIAFARDLGITIPRLACRSEVSDLIDGAITRREMTTPASESQLRYAKSLGIQLPKNPSRGLVSQLIDEEKARRWQQQAPRYRPIAERYGVSFEAVDNKRELFDEIKLHLDAPGRERDLVEWFVFRVHRELAGAPESDEIKSPGDLRLVPIVDLLVADERVIRSIRRYDGCDLIFFGEFTDSDGGVHTGGSRNTTAFKQTADALRSQLGPLYERARRGAARRGHSGSSGSSLGCVFAWVIALLGICVIIAYVLVFLFIA